LQWQYEIDWSWMNTSGIVLKYIHGDPNSCKDVIYTGHTNDPMGEGQNHTVSAASWKGLSYAVNTFPILNNTCLAFFQIANPFLPSGQAMPLHPVWGRLPATALVMKRFPKASILLYLDSDALIAFPDQNPTSMYRELAYDGYGENATFKQLQPALIVNKPFQGWLCGECERFGLGHGCFNSGALLWHRSRAATVVLQAWWESRHSSESGNLFSGEEPFHGWHKSTQEERWADSMGEQNRLMYIYHSNEAVHSAVWPVPRQRQVIEKKGISCPSDLEGHLPCLQNDFAHEGNWNVSKPSCFISHYADKKEKIIDHAALMLQSVGF
jgi:galactosyl transferase GMA12/MNN10 family